jgi:chromate reductase, NAD(P)H dehydrogenase (quinone)
MESSRSVRILAVSGSLRTASSNTGVVRAAASLAPDGVKVRIFDALADIPHFNPDLDGDNPPPAVARFRAELNACDAVLISSPEYAHGVPGTLKNALDWVVGSGELIAKPLALINASPRSTHAQASLTETLTTMSATVIADASITLPLSGRSLDAHGIAADPDLAGALRLAVAALARAAA